MAKKDTTRYYSDLQEKAIARKLEMKQQVNSGATLFAKGDVYDDYTLLDAKTVMSEQKSVSLKKEWFTKLKSEAFSMGKYLTGIVFRFEPKGEDYVAIPIDQYRDMYECYKENVLDVE